MKELVLGCPSTCKNNEEKTPKAAKRELGQQREISQNLQKTELETRDYELTKSKLYCRKFMTVRTASYLALYIARFDNKPRQRTHFQLFMKYQKIS
jgi:hypothetical protein